MWRFILFFLLAAAAVSCRSGGVPEEAVGAEKPEAASSPGGDDGSPLLLPDEPPLLLEDAGSGTDTTGADNERCHVCHLNYAVEELAVTHARAGVGCEQCHGASNAHCSDEDNITPPDIMFATAAINPACRECHTELSADEHEEILAGTAGTYCTDCHGEHRLTHRTRRWDRTTRALVHDDNVRMLTDDMLEDGASGADETEKE